MAELPHQLHSLNRARTIGIASAIWGGSIFISRILGLVREQVIGRTLGASRQADLYFASFTLPAEGIALETVEAELAKQAIERTGGNLTRAAQLLHISRDQLRYKLKKSGDYKENPSE